MKKAFLVFLGVVYLFVSGCSPHWEFGLPEVPLEEAQIVPLATLIVDKAPGTFDYGVKQHIFLELKASGVPRELYAEVLSQLETMYGDIHTSILSSTFIASFMAMGSGGFVYTFNIEEHTDTTLKAHYFWYLHFMGAMKGYMILEWDGSDWVVLEDVVEWVS